MTTLVLYSIKPSCMTDAELRARQALAAFPGIGADEVDDILIHLTTGPWALRLTLPDELAGTAAEHLIRDAFTTDADAGLPLDLLRDRIASRRELLQAYGT